MFSHILLPIDLQETRLAEKAVAIAIEECRKHQARLSVMTVLHGFVMPMVADFFPDEVMENALREVTGELERYIAATFPDDLTIEAIVDQGKPHDLIILQARERDIDLIIIPSHSKGIDHFLLGSCAAKVVEQSGCSVMVVKA